MSCSTWGKNWWREKPIFGVTPLLSEGIYVLRAYLIKSRVETKQLGIVETSESIDSIGTTIDIEFGKNLIVYSVIVKIYSFY